MTVLDEHLAALRRRNLSERTVAGRRYVLERLVWWAFGEGRGGLLDLSADALAEWARQSADILAPSTMRTELTNVRGFYRWAVKAGLVDTSPADDLELPRVARGLPRPTPDADIAHAIAEGDAVEAAVIGLAAFAGLRAVEIARLRWAHIWPGQIHVLAGKGGKGRVVPLSAVLADLLEPLRWMSRPYEPDGGPVIRGRKGRPLEAHRVSQLANTYLHSVGVAATLHQCRHRFLTAAYQSCRDIRAVQELAGHANPATSAIYTMVASDVAEKAVEDASTLTL